MANGRKMPFLTKDSVFVELQKDQINIERLTANFFGEFLQKGLSG